jgi:hypothetical protein
MRLEGTSLLVTCTIYNALAAIFTMINITLCLQYYGCLGRFVGVKKVPGPKKISADLPAL